MPVLKNIKIMPVLKNIKIDNIEDVTILVMKDISMRHGKFGEAVHVCLAEKYKTESDVMTQINDNSDICWSTETSHIDVLIDFPSAKSIDQFISELKNIREEHYGPIKSNIMKEQDVNQLKLEIQHIFDSGANEIRIFEMVKNFINKRY